MSTPEFFDFLYASADKKCADCWRPFCEGCALASLIRPFRIKLVDAKSVDTKKEVV